MKHQQINSYHDIPYPRHQFFVHPHKDKIFCGRCKKVVTFKEGVYAFDVDTFWCGQCINEYYDV